MPSKFNIPLDFSRLENDRLKLVPMEDNLEEWLGAYVQDGLENPRVYDYLTDGPYKTTEEALSMYQEAFADATTQRLLAVILKAGTISRKDPVTGEIVSFDVVDGTFAGMSGLAGNPDHATAGMGLMLCTKFHRTFVSTHVNGLTLHHLLDSPETGGLGLRRIEWQCNANNEASVHTAKRIGFQWEGITRFQQVLPGNKFGSTGAEINRPNLPTVGLKGEQWGAGRHTANLSLCWDDWLNGGREHVDTLMKR